MVVKLGSIITKSLFSLLILMRQKRFFTQDFLIFFHQDSNYATELFGFIKIAIDPKVVFFFIFKLFLLLNLIWIIFNLSPVFKK